MAFTTTVSIKGGAKMKAVLAKAEQNRRKSVKVGFFAALPSIRTGATPLWWRGVKASRVAGFHEPIRPANVGEGGSVANVAAILEFGAPNASIPERPFFRQSIAIMQDRNYRTW